MNWLICLTTLGVFVGLIFIFLEESADENKKKISPLGSLKGETLEPIPRKQEIKATRIAFGTHPEYLTKPITNLPPDTIKVRRRIRNQCAAVAFVKTKTTVEKWVLAPDGDGMKLQIFQGANGRWFHAKRIGEKIYEQV